MSQSNQVNEQHEELRTSLRELIKSNHDKVINEFRYYFNIKSPELLLNWVVYADGTIVKYLSHNYKRAFKSAQSYLNYISTPMCKIITRVSIRASEEHIEAFLDVLDSPIVHAP